MTESAAEEPLHRAQRSGRELLRALAQAVTGPITAAWQELLRSLLRAVVVGAALAAVAATGAAVFALGLVRLAGSLLGNHWLVLLGSGAGLVALATLLAWSWRRRAPVKP